MKIFGFEIGKAIGKERSKNIEGFSTPISTDGTIEINGSMTSAYYGHVLNIDDINVNDEKGLILKYRMAAAQPECDLAVSDIVNAAIVSDSDTAPVTLTLDALDYPEEIKRSLRDEFDNIVKMLNFSFDGHDLFRRWYIDGRIYFHLVVDPENTHRGIVEMRLIDPLKMKKVKEVTTRTNKETGTRVKYVSDEYYLYTEDLQTSTEAVKIHPDSICYVPSGILEESGTFAISYLHKCIKLVNQLRIMEDSLVIYRISRAPERRIFYIDTGNLPKGKAEEYVQGIMSKYKNKLVYDASSGEVREDRKSMNIMEDFWLPRREGGRGTEITTLPGGCLSMDTKVSLLDGRELSIAEIDSEMKQGKELWTYSCHPSNGKIIPGKISWAGVTQESAQVMKITLDNGEDIICTPDHKYPIYDKGFVEAKDLNVGDSLIPLYRRSKDLAKTHRGGYEQYFDNLTKKWYFTHRTVADTFKDSLCKHWIYKLENNRYDIRHHIDHNKNNNNPDNLCWMSWEDHSLYHNDNACWPEYAAALGGKAYLEKMQNFKESDPEGYAAYCEKLSIDHIERWKNQEFRDKAIAGMKNFYSNLSPEKLKELTEIRKVNSKKGNEKLQTLLENIEYKKWYSDQIKEGWKNISPEIRESRSIKISNASSDMWKGESGELLRQKHALTQKIEYDHSMLIFIIDLIKDKTSHQFSLNDVVNELNDNSEMLELLRDINKNKKVPNWKLSDGYTSTIVERLVCHYGYYGWADFRRKCSIHNHRIIAIEYLDEPIQVGTLTIDNEYHTFALSCGVFTKNSNLGEIDDIVFFQKKLYRALNVPVGRLEADNAYNMGRVSEISREEVKFQKFINKLRRKFSLLFIDTLRVQCILKKICTQDEWKTIRDSISVDFIEDNYFSELKEFEILKERLDVLEKIESHIGVGKYYSKKWVRSNVLNQSDEDVERMDSENAEEEVGGKKDDESSEDMGDQDLDGGGEIDFGDEVDSSSEMETEPEPEPEPEPEQ
jgi:hypothetical protein